MEGQKWAEQKEVSLPWIFESHIKMNPLVYGPQRVIINISGIPLEKKEGNNFQWLCIDKIVFSTHTQRKISVTSAWVIASYRSTNCGPILLKGYQSSVYLWSKLCKRVSLTTGQMGVSWRLTETLLCVINKPRHLLSECQVLQVRRPSDDTQSVF